MLWIKNIFTNNITTSEELDDLVHGIECKKYTMWKQIHELRMKNKKITELTLTQILSHGKEGAVNGVIKMEDGKRIAFSNFYLFQGAKGHKIK